MGVQLSADQADVMVAMCQWTGGNRSISADPLLLKVGGYAGTGKTTVLGEFAKVVSAGGTLAAYVSFTGRAASVLGRTLRSNNVAITDKTRTSEDDDDLARSAARSVMGKYLDASLGEHSGPAFFGTIHRLLYRPIINSAGELTGWTKRVYLDRKYDVIVIDEASMVGDALLADLQEHGVPILAVGDHGQLYPVMDKGSLMEFPDLRLEKIHRQAEGNPIIQLSKVIREGGKFLDFKGASLSPNGNSPIKYISRLAFEPALALAYHTYNPLDVGVLCYTNKVRIRLNLTARKVRGMKGPPREGEPLICLRNRSPIYNGMRGILVKDAQPYVAPHCMRDPSAVGACSGPGKCSCECAICDNPTDDVKPRWILKGELEFPEEGITAAQYRMCAAQFNREGTFTTLDELKAARPPIDVVDMRDAGDLYDFGYGMTVHKSQGSQFKHVVFYTDTPEKPWNEEWRRFAYTAVTRASESLTVLK